MNLIKRYTPLGEPHGLVNVLANSVPFNDFADMTGENKEKARKQKLEDARIVKIRYINFRGTHERLTKHYCRYAGDPIQQWHLIPNQEYDVPFGLVAEVNGTRMPQRSGLVSIDGSDVNDDGSPLTKDQSGIQLHQLVPANFY